MKGFPKRVLACALSVMMIASGLMIAQKAEAAVKLSMPKTATVKEGKSATLKITASGYIVKKVSCESEAKNVTIKTSKKAVIITAKKGTGGQSDYLATTIKAKKGSKTKTFKFYTSVTIQGSSAPASIKEISTLDELKAIDAKSNTKYVLQSDIDMSGWTKPIDYMYCSIDGNGHSLTNLSVPFVGKLYGGTIENLTFDITMESFYELEDHKYIAPICYIGPGNSDETATIKKCASYGYIKVDNASGDKQSSDMYPIYVAGLVGDNPNDYGMVENCLNRADITTGGYPKVAVGGIIGSVAGKTGKAVIKECKNAGGISIDNSGDPGMGCGVGGIAGYAMSSAVTKDCLNTGNVSATGKDRSGGGITGFGDQRLENCVNLGRTSFGVVGGKVDKDIIDSWNYSAQMFTNVYYIGAIENGFNWKKESVDVPGVKSVSDVTDQSAFAGLDFSGVWTMTASGPDLISIPS